MIETTKDGRTIRRGNSYTAFRLNLWHVQHGLCIECGIRTNPSYPITFKHSFHVAHRGTRGLGGCFRDDVVGPNKGQVEGGKCGECHRKEHNQQ